jgi:hypothetical protein
MEGSSSESGNADLEEKVDELENKVERIDERTKGTNSIEMRAYDLSVSMRSEEASMEKLAQIGSCEMEKLTRRALIGEYQEIEEEDLFSIILGGD